MARLDLLKKVRAVSWVNRPVRNAIRWMIRGEEALNRVLLARWPVAGELDLEVGGVPFKIFANSDDNIANVFFYRHQSWEEEALLVWSQLAPQARVILDVGAHTGINSIVASRANPEARIFAFEPHPTNYARMLRNFALNPGVSVQSEAFAVGDAEGTIAFTVPANDGLSLVSSAVGEFSRGHFGIPYKDIRVRQDTLDGYAERAGLDTVDLLKIDVEYYEEKVLRGAQRTLQRFAPTVLMEVFNYDVFTSNKPELKGRISPDVGRAVEAFMLDLGYTIYAFGPKGLLRVKDLRSIPNGDSNYLFSKVVLEEAYTPYRDRATLRRLLPASRDASTAKKKRREQGAERPAP